MLGRENIIFDVMTNTNRPTFYVEVYPFWSIKFIILAKTGILYLFTTMYDPFDKAELQLDLRKSSTVTATDLVVHVKVAFSTAY